MRLQATKNRELKSEAFKMYQQGKYNKEIANALNTTEKTVGRWVKGFKQQTKKKETVKTNLINKLEQTLKDENSTPKDVYCLIQSLRMWENIVIY